MDFRQQQEAEIEVLKAIFGDDFEVVMDKKTAWKSINAAQEFRVCVRPLEEDLKDRVRVKIHFKLPAKYPKAVPTMSLEEPMGLSALQLTTLHQSLGAAAAPLVGGEMLYELCSFAAAFITDRNQASERGGPTSLGEQRRKRSEEEEKATADAQMKEAAEAAWLRSTKEAAEATRLGKLISEDVARKEALRLSRQKVLEDDKEVNLVLASDGTRRARMMVQESEDDEGRRESWVKLGDCVGGDWLGRILPAEIEWKSQHASAQVFDILAPYFVTSQGKRKLARIESDLRIVASLRHPHLQTLHTSLLTEFRPSFFPPSPYATPSSRSMEGWTLLVLTETIRSQTLEELLHSCGELRTDKAVGYLGSLAQAVEFLHGSNVVHRGLRPRSVFMGTSGKKGDRDGIKLGEAAWWQRLVDLNKSDPWVLGGEGELPDPWTCPGAVDEPFVYDRPRDMWDLGIVFAQMLFGLDVYRRYPSPAELIRGISRESAPVVRRVLTDLLLTDSKRRITASRLVSQLFDSSTTIVADISSPGLSTTPKSSSFWPTAFGAAHQPLTPLAVPSAVLSKSIDAQVGFFWQPRASGSRYRSEFEELEFLGRGGGGQVVKARNRLDGHLYAIKKINLPNDRASEAKILREVTIWSRMNHPNIVRYHTSWVETDEQAPSYDDDSSTQETETETDESASHSNDPSEFDSSEEGDSFPGNDLDIDLGLDDLDDTDFLSVGHSKSISYPSIHFGNEDDPSRPGSTAANSPMLRSKAATRVSTPVDAMSKSVRTMYIQMEYVEKLTLKEAIEDGVTEADSWRLIFQILSAMLHTTSINIIHRDLKPSNIFLDVNGDVRIGDFGLAVNQGLADPADLLLSVDSSMDAVDLTSGVGTSLYIAPESTSRGRNDKSIKYSNKIDMYSLGIVFFELWHPFKTGMERIQVLRDLRKREIMFPSTWDSVKMARHTRIIRTCLAHDPELRASPKDLLNSDLLPPRVGDDSIEETIRLLSHSGTPHAQTLITALFNQSAEDRIRKDFSYDFYDGQGAKVDNDPYGEIVRDKLQQVFRRKGAVCMDSPLLMPYSSIYAARNPVRLLDADGTIACLPFQLNIPFCRMVARDASLTRLKRWTIAPVYRTSAAGGQPRAVLNAAFDIVSDAVTAATEAECLFVIEDCIAAFPFPGETVHFLNHSKILEAIVDRIPAKRRSAVLDVFVQHGRLQRSWAKTAVELLKIQGVTRAMVDEMGHFDFAGDITEIRRRVLAAVPRLKHLVQEGFDELEAIVNLKLCVKTIKIAPLLATNWDFHRDGVLFETHHVLGKTREVIAAGGRFDEVVSRLAAPEVRYSGRCPHVVGFSMSVAKLSLAAAEANAATGKASISKKEESLRSYGPYSVRRCDIYVVSFAPNLVELRLSVVRDLWRAGMRADLMYDDLLSLSPEAMVSACRREGIHWLVIVKGRSGPVDESEQTVKVKSVLRGYEEEVPRSDLPSYFVHQMREQALVDESVSGSIDPAAVESTGTAEATKPLQDYFPILADEDVRHKGKHKQRTILVRHAQKSVEAAASAAAEAPVFCIDIDGAAFVKMSVSTAWILDDESFRAIVQAAGPAKRVYLSSIRQTISKHRLAKPDVFSRFWLFSLRDDRSSLLTYPNL